MPEFLTLLPPDEARKKLLSHLSAPLVATETIDVASALGRISAEDIHAPQPLPDFQRTTVDGYAVRARDTFGATDSLPGYLNLIGEVPMGDAPSFEIGAGQCALIHTGGMLPPGADAVVMLEYTQHTQPREGSETFARLEEVEIFRAVADGENVIRVGEDVAQGQLILPQGSRMRPAEIGGLMAAGITSLRAFTSSVSGYWQAATLQITNGTSAVTVPAFGVVTLYGVAPPALKAWLEGPGRLSLSWPRAEVGYILQSSPSPVDTANWRNDTNTPAFANGSATVNVTAAAAPRFYRLVLP